MAQQHNTGGDRHEIDSFRVINELTVFAPSRQTPNSGEAGDVMGKLYDLGY